MCEIESLVLNAITDLGPETICTGLVCLLLTTNAYSWSTEQTAGRLERQSLVSYFLVNKRTT